jgi:hypothetical protein
MTEEGAEEKARLLWGPAAIANVDDDGRYRVGRMLPMPQKHPGAAPALVDELYDWRGESDVSFEDAFEKAGYSLSLDEIRLIDRHSGLVFVLSDGTSLNVEGASRVADIVTVAVGPDGEQEPRDIPLANIRRVTAFRVDH